ncbi:Hypp4963 [Branchiostoma lanceolatum]|uniref:Hypp4963 protein n=1 Tax=Branchiostoma lanceolatum TaxID=7740 RepID=A0A8K0F0D7_BRALA|nr:Hypp4963 [Branchiostoma lanceolatum]
MSSSPGSCHQYGRECVQRPRQVQLVLQAVVSHETAAAPPVAAVGTADWLDDSVENHTADLTTPEHDVSDISNRESAGDVTAAMLGG